MRKAESSRRTQRSRTNTKPDIAGASASISGSTSPSTAGGSTNLLNSMSANMLALRSGSWTHSPSSARSEGMPEDFEDLSSKEFATVHHCLEPRFNDRSFLFVLSMCVAKAAEIVAVQACVASNWDADPSNSCLRQIARRHSAVSQGCVPLRSWMRFLGMCCEAVSKMMRENSSTALLGSSYRNTSSQSTLRKADTKLGQSALAKSQTSR